MDTKGHKGIIFCLISVLILWGNRDGALFYLSSAFKMFVVLLCLLKCVERDSPPQCPVGLFPKTCWQTLSLGHASTAGGLQWCDMEQHEETGCLSWPSLNTDSSWLSQGWSRCHPCPTGRARKVWLVVCCTNELGTDGAVKSGLRINRQGFQLLDFSAVLTSYFPFSIYAMDNMI